MSNKTLKTISKIECNTDIMPVIDKRELLILADPWDKVTTTKEACNRT
jgi:hypothetical protein